jgi:hypothetical protein
MKNRIFDNIHDLQKGTILSRLRTLDTFVDCLPYEVRKADMLTAVSYVAIESVLSDDLITSLLSSPITQAETDAIQQNISNVETIKAAYIAMIARLDQIQNAGTIPFTQAGFNQIVQAVKDEALYIERIMKFLKSNFS